MAKFEIAKLVEVVVQLLKQREQAVCQVTLAQLAEPLKPQLLLYHATLKVTQVDWALLQALSRCDASNPAVANLMNAVSLGMRVEIGVPASLMGQLCPRSLARAPLHFWDLSGAPVTLLNKPVVSYADVVQQNGGWLVLPGRALVTPLAREVLVSRNIELVTAE